MKGDLAQRRTYDQTDILLLKGEGKGKDNGKGKGKGPQPAFWHQVWRCQGGELQSMWRGPLHETWKSAAQAVAADEAAKAAAAEASAAGASREEEGWRTWTGWRGAAN